MTLEWKFGNKFLNPSYECGVKTSPDINLNANSGLGIENVMMILKGLTLFFCAGSKQRRFT